MVCVNILPLNLDYHFVIVILRSVARLTTLTAQTYYTWLVHTFTIYSVCHRQHEPHTITYTYYRSLRNTNLTLPPVNAFTKEAYTLNALPHYGLGPQRGIYTIPHYGLGFILLASCVSTQLTTPTSATDLRHTCVLYNGIIITIYTYTHLLRCVTLLSSLLSLGWFTKID